MRTYEYAQKPVVREGSEIPQCPGVYGDPLLAHEKPPM